MNGNGTLTRLYSTGAAYAGKPYTGGGLSSTGTGVAIDGSGNIWVTSSGSPGSLAKFNSLGIAQSPSTGYTAEIEDPSAIAIDGSGNVWVYNQQAAIGLNEYYFVKLNNADGSLAVGISGTTVLGPPQLAIDRSGNVWNGGAGTQLQEIPAGDNGPFGLQPNTYTDNWIGDPQGIAVDGSNRLWVASAGQSTAIPPVSPNLSLFDPQNIATAVNTYVDTNLSNGASSVAVDASGNVWVLSGNNTVAEYVGLATPVVTPLSAGVKNNELGTKP